VLCPLHARPPPQFWSSPLAADGSVLGSGGSSAVDFASADYWEQRAKKAEATRDKYREALEKIGYGGFNEIVPESARHVARKALYADVAKVATD
jgi:hypothetical protein